MPGNQPVAAMRAIRTLICLFGLAAPLPSPAEGPPPALVVVTEVREQEIAETNALLGVIDFDRISAVSGEVAGLITRHHATQGAWVKQGQPLVELNTDFIHKDMDIKRKQRDQVSADLQKAGSSLKRLQSLIKSNSASRQAYDDTLYDHQSLRMKRQTLDQELERLQLQLDKSTVRAPFDGIVLEKLKEQGEWIDHGTPVARLASTADVILKVALPEKFMRFQQPGLPLVVTIDALDQRIEGNILGIMPVATLRSKSATLKIALPYLPGMIQNMSALVDVPTGEKRRLPVVPRDALVRFNDRDFVYTVESGRAKQTPVEILMRSGVLAGIRRSPLTAGMKVVIDGNDRLRPDQPVQVIDRNDGPD